MTNILSMVVQLLLLFSSVAVSADDQIELVAVTVDDNHRNIIHQQYDGYWSEPEILSNRKLDDFTPAIIVDLVGNLIVVWSELSGNGASQLLFRIRHQNNWSKARPIKSAAVENTLPTLGMDSTGQVWCFWSGLDGADDEIYASTLNNDTWSKPQKIYQQDNLVPDINPTTFLDTTGDLNVTWVRFDRESFTYVDYRTVLQGIGSDGKQQWSQPQKYVVNPLLSLGKLPDKFSLPVNIEEPKTVSLFLPTLPNQTLHYGRLQFR